MGQQAVLDDDYARRARQHAPQTLTETREAAQRLLGDGYSIISIGAALRLDVAAVRRLLGEEA